MFINISFQVFYFVNDLRTFKHLEVEKCTCIRNIIVINYFSKNYIFSLQPRHWHGGYKKLATVRIRSLNLKRINSKQIINLFQVD